LKFPPWELGFCASCHWREPSAENLHQAMMNALFDSASGRRGKRLRRNRDTKTKYASRWPSRISINKLRPPAACQATHPCFCGHLKSEPHAHLHRLHSGDLPPSTIRSRPNEIDGALVRPDGDHRIGAHRLEGREITRRDADE
jgi:hypothetical protein